MELTNLTHTSFEDTCRVCLANNGALVDIFRCQNRNISEEIHYCSGVLINVSDNLPPNICVACLKELSVACNFKRKCLKADEVFRQVLIVEQVEYLEDYFQATEQEPSSSIYVADIDKENTEIFLSSNNIENASQTNNQTIINTFQSNSIENTEQTGILERTQIRKEHIQKLTEQTSILERTKIENEHYQKLTEQTSILDKTKIENEHYQTIEHISILETNIDKKDGVDNFEGRLEISKTLEDVPTEVTTKNNCENENNGYQNKNCKKNHLCELCGETFSTHVTYLTHHMREHKKHKLPQYHCNVCGFITDNKYRLSTHMKKHSTVFEYICDYCNRQFIYKNTLIYHIWQHMHKGKNLKCIVCNKIFGNIRELEEHQKVHLEDKRIYACDKCPAKYCQINNYWCHMSVKHGGQTKRKKHVTAKSKPNVKIEFEVINSTDDLINKLVEEIRSEKNTKEFPDTVDNYIDLDDLTDNDNSDNTLRDDEILNTKDTTERNSTFNTLQKGTNIECVEDRDDKNLKIKEVTQQIMTLTKPQDMRILLQDVLIRDDKTPKRKEITEKTGTLITDQNRTPIQIQDIVEINTTGDVTSECAPIVSKTSEIAEQISTLNTVQKRTKNEIYAINLEGSLKMDKIRDVPTKFQPRVYTCRKCGMTFDNRNAVARHRRKVHSTSYTCEICRIRLSSRNSYTVHLRTHYVSKYQCDLCDHKSARKSDLKIHKLEHHPTVPQFHCDLCGYISTTKGYLRKHMLNQHLGGLKYQCDFCTRKFSSKQNLRDHISQFHLNAGKGHSCSLCNRKFLTKEYLMRHLKEHLYKRPTVKIPTTEQKTKDISSKSTPKISNREVSTEQAITLKTLQNRTAIEMQDVVDIDITEDTPSKCSPIISKTSEIIEQISTLNTVHKRTNNEIPAKNLEGSLKMDKIRNVPTKVQPRVYTCTKCGKTFEDNNAVARHRRKVHPTPYTCQICGMRLSDRSCYSVHLRTHYVFKYQCDLCDHKSTRKSDLILHKLEHHSIVVPQYHCDVCGYICAKKDSIREHMVNKHLGQTSTLNTVQKRTKKEIYAKNLEGKLKMDKIRDAPTKVQPRVYTCTKCGMTFDNRNAVARHRRKVHPTPYTCQICGMRLSDRSCYSVHLRTHYVFKYQCDLCDHKSTRKSDLILHKLEHHSVVVPQYHCDVCGYICAKKDYIREHMVNKHLERTSTLKTVQNRTPIEIQDVWENDSIEDIQSIGTPLMGKTSQITGQTSTLNTVQKRTKKEIYAKNLEGKLKMDKIRDAPTKVQPRVYTCTKCGMTFDNRNAVAKHRRKVHPTPYTCQICGMRLSDRSCYSVHLRTHYVFKYQCDLCDHKSTRKSDLILHKLEHHSVVVPQYHCDVCGYICAKKDYIREHMVNKHLGQTSTLNTVQKRTKKEIYAKNLEGKLKMDKIRDAPTKVQPRVYTCTKCGMTFDNRNAVAKHRRKVHPTPYTCQICGMRLSDRNCYSVHLRTHYVLKYQCELCGHKSARKRDSMLHKLEHHSTVVPQYHCDVCGYICAKKDSIREHMVNEHLEQTSTLNTVQRRTKNELHAENLEGRLKIDKIRNVPTNDKPRVYTCTKCDMTFDYRNAVDRHRQKVHSSPYTCEICGKQFHVFASLFQHKLIHGPAQYECDVCGYKTVRKYDLVKHVNIHSGINKYICEHCKHNFNFKKNLAKHMRLVHLKNIEKKFKCTACDRRYCDRRELDNHFRARHLKIKRYLCEHCPSSFFRYNSYRTHVIIKHNVVFPKMPQSSNLRKY